MRTKSFQDLNVWQKSMELTQKVYEITAGFPKHEVFGLTSQMRRAAVSIPSNIAEGYGRAGDKAFALFLTQSRGSLYELQTQALLAESLKYIPAASNKRLQDSADQLARMLNALLNKLNATK